MNRAVLPINPVAAHRLAVRDLTVSYHRIPALHHIGFDLECG